MVVFIIFFFNNFEWIILTFSWVICLGLKIVIIVL